VAYSAAEVIQRAAVVMKISAPVLQELSLCEPGIAFLGFYHLAVAPRGVFEKLIERSIAAIGCEIIQTDDGRLPVLAPMSEIAGRMATPIAAHLLRSSSGGRGILLGGSPGVPPAHVVILGAGTVGSWAARTARAAGARVTLLDIDAEALRRVMEHAPGVATEFAEPESIAAAIATADVAIGAVLVAGARTPHLVTRAMVESMRPGSALIDISIDQGGCFETSRPTTIAEPTFVHNGVVHYCVPNLTCDMGRSSSTAVAQAVLPYLLRIADLGIDDALRGSPELARGVYTYHGDCVHPTLAQIRGARYREIASLLERKASAW
jgi:alanine dehydrogenase